MDISLLNSEISMMRKAVLQNHMVLDIVTSFQGDTWTIIQTELCVFKSDVFSNITHLITHMKNQISALLDPLPTRGDLLGSWFGSRSSWLP